MPGNQQKGIYELMNQIHLLKSVDKTKREKGVQIPGVFH
jgi:hypothetical protein